MGGHEKEEEPRPARQTADLRGEGHFPEHFAEEDGVVAELEWQWPQGCVLKHTCLTPALQSAVLPQGSLLKQRRPWGARPIPTVPFRRTKGGGDGEGVGCFQGWLLTGVQRKDNGGSLLSGQACLGALPSLQPQVLFPRDPSDASVEMLSWPRQHLLNPCTVWESPTHGVTQTTGLPKRNEDRGLPKGAPI